MGLYDVFVEIVLTGIGREGKQMHNPGQEDFLILILVSDIVEWFALSNYKFISQDVKKHEQMHMVGLLSCQAQMWRPKFATMCLRTGGRSTVHPRIYIN